MPERLTPEQAETLRRYVDHARARPGVLGVVLSGSLARGWGDERSDVDVIVLVTDDELARRRADHTELVWDESFAAYPGGAIDAKHVDRAYLELAAERASEPTRNAFFGARVAWSDDPGLAGLVARIGRFPEDGVDDRVARFCAHLETCRWFIGEADKRADAYLRSWVATRAALFACRVILAHNRVLFPFHKWVRRALDECPDRPAGLRDAIDRALASPGVASVHPLCDLVLRHRAWPEYPGGWAAAFCRDVERAWMRHEPGVEDL